MDFTAKNTKRTAPKISIYFAGIFLKKHEIQNPKKEFIKVIIPIIMDGLKQLILLNLIEAPAPNASILVAIDKEIRQIKEIQLIFLSFLFSNAL